MKLVKRDRAFIRISYFSVSEVFFEGFRCLLLFLFDWLVVVRLPGESYSLGVAI